MEDLKMRIAVDDKDVRRALGTLGKKADIVMARAANRTIATANKALSKGVRKRYPKVKDRDVRKALFKRKATSSNPTAALTYKSMHENLYKMGFVSPQRIVRYHDPDHYEARVMEQSPMVSLMGRPRPFVQMMSNGHVGLFRRKTQDGMKSYGGDHKRNAIEALYAPAISQMMKNDEVLQDAEKVSGEAFLKRLEHEIDWELRR